METIATKIRLHRVQKAFRQSSAPYRGFVGGRGAGKTWVGAYDLVRRAQRDRTYLVASPTSVLMQDTTYPTLKAIAELLNRWPGPAGVRLSPYPTVKLTTGATIRFRTAEDPERMRGPNLSGVWLDEASLMPHEAYLISIAALREAGEHGWLSATFTPKGLSHWTYDLFGSAKPNTEIFHARTGNNPFAPEGFEDRLRQQYTGLFARQELEGAFVAIEGAEWPPEYFGDDLWFADWPSLPWAVTALALDPSKGKDASKSKQGRSPDYSAYVWGAVDGTGTIWIDADLDNTRDVARLVLDGIGHFRHCPIGSPRAFVIEVNQFQSLLATEFARHSKTMGLHLPLWGIDNYENKQVRIRSIGPFLARRELRFRDTPGCRKLVEQLRDFPQGAYDDGPDALEMLLRMLLHLIRGGSGTSQPRMLRI